MLWNEPRSPLWNKLPALDHFLTSRACTSMAVLDFELRQAQFDAWQWGWLQVGFKQQYLLSPDDTL